MVSLLSRAVTVLDPRPREQRVVHQHEDGSLESFGVDLLGQMRSTALSRRLSRDNADLAATYAAVFAAIRWREQAITRPQIVLQQRQGGEWKVIGTTDDPKPHPALAGLRRPNATTTSKQGRGGIERGKLTNGDHYWVKRRTPLLGVPVEFEIWDGASTRAVARKDKPWVPDHFERRTADGRVIQVAPEDVIWFRHIVDPRDPMRSLTPIGAIRVQADTGYEALRANQRYYDQGINAGGVLVPGEGGLGPTEVERITQKINEDWKGTDNQHRWHLLEENLKLLSTPMTNVDLQYIETLRWGVVETARAFEVSPITLKDFEKATYTNADQAGAQDWETVRNQLDATLEELNLGLIEPDFGPDFRVVALYAGIGPLQDSMKTAAEVDDIKLKGGRTTINELRKRDGEEPVAWGDIPIMPSNMLPLGTGARPEQFNATPGDEPGNEPAQAAISTGVMRDVLAAVDRAGGGRELKNAIRKAFAGKQEPEPERRPRVVRKEIEYGPNGKPTAVVEREIA